MCGRGPVNFTWYDSVGETGAVGSTRIKDIFVLILFGD
jgi:hypothetical protein